MTFIPCQCRAFIVQKNALVMVLPLYALCLYFVSLTKCLLLPQNLHFMATSTLLSLILVLSFPPPNRGHTCQQKTKTAGDSTLLVLSFIILDSIQSRMIKKHVGTSEMNYIPFKFLEEKNNRAFNKYGNSCCRQLEDENLPLFT